MGPLYQTFTDLMLAHWARLLFSHDAIAISIYNLSVADVVSVSRHLNEVQLTADAVEAIDQGSNIILRKFNNGEIIYGVNTGQNLEYSFVNFMSSSNLIISGTATNMSVVLGGCVER